MSGRKYYTSGNSDSGGDVNFSNPSYAWDKDSGDYATLDMEIFDDSDILTGTAHDNVESSGTIYAVVLEIDGHLSITATSDFTQINITPIFNGTPGDEYEIKLKDIRYFDAPNYLTVDITNDPAGPGSGSWAWSDVNTLDFSIEIESWDSMTVSINQLSIYVMTSLYGIEIYDSAGSSILNMNDIVTRYIWTTTVSGGASGSQNLTIYHPSVCEITIEVVAYALEQGKMVHDTNGPLSIRAISSPIVKTSTVKNITWTAQSITNGVSTFASSNSIILVFVH